jgi:alkanesulfonate monooxygenase SsuD/methylene tetrahydromethanopterin reductase-like flavin-dependent oxidoreductase (luciferase family)
VVDHGREIRFGYFLVPLAASPLIATAIEVESLGFDYLAVQDHPYQRRYVETWTLLSVLAGRTSRIALFPDVLNIQLRQPAVLAKAAASLDLLSGGRVELGLGAGAFPEAVVAYGGPGRTGAAALRGLEETITIIRKVWSDERNLRFDGEHYQLAGAQAGPVPAHDIGVWVGAYQPKALALTGGVADGWVPSYHGDPAALRDMAARLDDAAFAAGRQPGDLRRVLNLGDPGPDAGATADLLTRFAVELGFDTFVLGGDPAGARPFAEQVVPRVRDQVATARHGPGPISD